VDAAGPDTNGFAPRDRVAWRDTTDQRGEQLDDLILIDQDDVLGVPSWITDEQTVSYLGPGLIARALVRTRPFARGDDVRVVSTYRVVAEITAAWARSLGARIIDPAVDGPAQTPGSRSTMSRASARRCSAATASWRRPPSRCSRRSGPVYSTRCRRSPVSRSAQRRASRPDRSDRPARGVTPSLPLRAAS